MRHSTERVLAVLAAAMLFAVAGFASAADTDFIRTRAELDATLAANPDSPINALSPGARERFLISLKFSEAGLVSLDPHDIADELSDEQIHALMSSFGPRVLAYAPKSHAQETRAYDRRASKNTGISALERQYNDFYLAVANRDSTDPAERVRQLGDIFDAQLGALYTSAALRRADDHELRLLRRAARDVAVSTSLPRHIGAFEQVFAERTRRRLVSTDDVQSMRELYLTLHRFTDARRLTSAHPGAALAPLPQFQDSLGDAAGRATVWRMDESGKRLTRTAVDLVPLQILVAAACDLSQDAARDIGNDTLLGPVFAGHAQWLVPAPGQESLEAVRDWNRKLPRAQVAMIYDREEWRVLPHWTMPTFFILRDGKVIDSATGWQSGLDETRDQLVAALRRTGLLPAP